MMNFNYSILIGRFQPFHKSHLDILKHSLDEAEKVLVVLGSYRTAPSFRNPWSVEEREQMVRACLDKEENKRVHFIPVRDHLYNDSLWLAEVQQKIYAILEPGATVCLNGNFKDDTSYYLNMFPQWKFIGQYLDPNPKINGTDIREDYFCEDKGLRTHWLEDTPEPVIKYLSSYKDSETYKNITEEWAYVREYKAGWKGSPFPPVFMTTDAVIVKSGHILVIERGVNPGKGLFALPGGFLDNDKSLLDSCIRELKEETRILMPEEDIRSHLKENKVFDLPTRSLRGRTITNAFFFKLPDKGTLPIVKGSDDAKRAMWMPVGDIYLNEDKFFEDHVHIINHFINKV